MNKILIDEATVKLALEALVYASSYCDTYNAITALKALAEQQSQQEPVAWLHEWEDGERIPLMYPQDDRNDDKPKSVRPLVFGDTFPPAQKEPVTEAQIVAGARVLNRRMADMCSIDAEDQWKQYGEDFRADARAVLEAAHSTKEKNNG